MASENGTTPHSVGFLETLRKKPYRYEFYWAVRNLECIYRDFRRIGTSKRGSEDPIRFGQDPFFEFSRNHIQSFGRREVQVLRRKKEDAPERLAVRILGLFGPDGPLPLAMTQYAWDRNRPTEKRLADSTLVDFADVFHHRLISLYYRAWAQSEPTVQLDRPDEDRFRDYIGALIGVGMPTLRDRDAFPDYAKLFFAGRLSCQSRPPDGLEAILKAYLGVSASIEEFVGKWIDLPPEGEWRLGAPGVGQLGKSTIIGKRVWQRHLKFRVTLGPMLLEQYRRLVPDSPTALALLGLLDNYVGYELDWEVRLVLHKDEVPQMQFPKSRETPVDLGAVPEAAPAAPMGPRLGYDTWLIADGAREHSEGIILTAEGITRSKSALDSQPPQPIRPRREAVST